MEDMCQLTERQTEHKYRSSYEQIGKALRKYSAIPQLDLVSVIMELYDAYPAVKENLDARFAQDKAESKAKLLEKYKKIIQDEYFPSKGEEKCRINVCKKAIEGQNCAER